MLMKKNYRVLLVMTESAFLRRLSEELEEEGTMIMKLEIQLIKSPNT